MGRPYLIVLCVLFAVSSACAKKSAPAAEAPARPLAVADDLPAPPEPPALPRVDEPAAPLSEEESFRRKSLDELNAEQPLALVHFDYDSSLLRDDARATLQRNAAWLMRWSSTRASVEGHCDERGTVEYNLALGERRAAAVRDYLVSLGIDAERLQPISKGKESPLCAGASEDCHGRNRRGQFVVTAK
jgi:peptidoglycan-associated lipoprotein